MKHAKRGSVLGAALVIALAMSLVLAGLLKWVDSEKRITKRHMLSARAKYAAEAVSEYGAAQIRTALERKSNITTNEFNTGPDKPKKPKKELLENELTDLEALADSLGIKKKKKPKVTEEEDTLETSGTSGSSGSSGTDETSTTATSSYSYSADQLFASSFSNIRWEVVSASSPGNAEDPLRGQKVYLRELSLLAAASVSDELTGQKVNGYAEQRIQVRDAPLFGYAMFYNMNLEIAPGAEMEVYGPVQTNGNVYVQSAKGLNFHEVVASAGSVFHGRAPGTSSSTDYAAVNFMNSDGTLIPMLQGTTWVDGKVADWAQQASQLWKGNVLSAEHGTVKANPAGIPSYVPDDPLTTDNELKNYGHLLIEPATENDNSVYPGDDIEVEKFATKASVVLEVSSSSGNVKAYKYVASASGKYVRDTGSGASTYERKEIQVPSGLIVGGDASEKFYDTRRARWIKVLDIDVGKLKTLIEDDSQAGEWTKGSNSFSPATEWNGVVYIEHKSTTSGAIRLVNGSQIPNRPTAANENAMGFTIATNVPAYIKGNYNADGVIPSDASQIRSPDSSSEPPAAVAADAVTILSNNWSDTNSALSLSNRLATPTEVAAAIVTGIVPTNKKGNGAYSGGVENLPRFLEKWSNVKFGYRGSMVVLYESTIATESWGSSNVYDPPVRVWGFNSLFGGGTFPPGRLISRSYRRINYQSLPEAAFQARLLALGFSG